MEAIYATKITKVVDSKRITEYLRLVSSDKRKRLERYQFYDDFIRSLYGEVIVRKALQRQTGIDVAKFKFDYNTYGKPYLSNIPEIHFNISHSKDWVVCIISEEECGIDIEKIAQPNYKLAERFFSQAENTTLHLLKMEEQIEYYYDLWTLKESYVKLTGKGLRIPLNSFEFKKSQGQYHIKVDEVKLNVPIIFQQYYIAKGYKMSVCINNRVQKPHNINIMEL